MDLVSFSFPWFPLKIFRMCFLTAPQFVPAFVLLRKPQQLSILFSYCFFDILSADTKTMTNYLSHFLL